MTDEMTVEKRRYLNADQELMCGGVQQKSFRTTVRSDHRKGLICQS